MPKDFDNCVKNKGRVRTIKPNKGSYLHICYKGGKSYSGEVKHVKNLKENIQIKLLEKGFDVDLVFDPIVEAYIEECECMAGGIGIEGTPEEAIEIPKGTFEIKKNIKNIVKDDRIDSEKNDSPLKKIKLALGTITDDRESDTEPDDDYPVDTENTEKEQEKDFDNMEDL